MTIRPIIDVIRDMKASKVEEPLEPIPAPERPWMPTTAAEGGAKTLAKRAGEAGWSVEMFAARGPYIDSNGVKVLRVCDAFAVRGTRDGSRFFAWWTRANDGKWKGESRYWLTPLGALSDRELKGRIDPWRIVRAKSITAGRHGITAVPGSIVTSYSLTGLQEWFGKSGSILSLPGMKRRGVRSSKRTAPDRP